MRTLDSRGAPVGAIGALRRDLRLLWHITGMVVGYFTVGGRIRRRYRAREAAGETYWVDAPEGDEPLP